MSISKKQFTRGLILRPDDIGVDSIEGELKIALTAKKFQVYLDGALRNVVLENNVATLTNKTFDANGVGNVLSNVEVADLAAGVLNTSSTFVGATDLQVPSALAVKTAIDLINSDLGDDVEGPVSSTDNAITRFDGITGKLLQNSSVTIDDTGVIARAAGLVLNSTAGNIVFTPVSTGESTFNYSVRHLNSVFSPSFTDATAGANVALTVGDKSTITLTAATSVDTLTPYSASVDGQLVTLVNGTASPITINNETGAALGGRIRTGSGTSHILPSYGSISLIYSTALSRWSLSGGNTALVDHMANATGAHAASAIANTPSGNLAATNAQAALNELQGDIDTANTNLANHLADAIDAHDASAISNVPAGNLAATEVQAALNELQTDIDTRATSTALSNHESSTVAHGATGAVVGTTNIQTLTNKTLTDPVINSPTGIVKADVGLANVDNTSDLAKPISTVTQTALDAKAAGAASSVDNHLARFSGTTGKIIKDGSTPVLSDAGILSGLTGLTSSGDLNSTGKLVTAGISQESVNSDGATTGANASLAALSGVTRLSNASLTSIDMISAGVSGQPITIINQTGNAITINNNTGATAANRILTGTKAALTLADEASILLKYDSTETRWQIIGGSGAAGGTAALDTIFQLTGMELLSTWSTGDNATFLGGGTLSGTFAYNTVTPLSGMQSYKYTQAAGSLNDYLASPAQDVDLRFRGQDVTLFFPYKYDGVTNDIEVVFYDVTNSAIIPSSVYLNNSPAVSIFKTNITIPTTCSSIRVGFQTDVLNSGKTLEFADVQLVSNLFSVTNLDTNAGRISEVIYTSQTTAPTNFIPTTNVTIGSSGSAATYIGGAYVDLYNILWAQAGLSTTAGDPYKISSAKGASAAADWAANKTIAVDFTTNEVFVRTKGSARNLGSYQDSDNKEHTHNIQTGDNFGTSAGLMYAVNTNQPQRTTLSSGGTEARPKNVALNAYLRYSEGVPAILTPTETFSSDTAAFAYSSTYTLATLANAPVGTYITYTYALNTNTRTQTTTRPTQTDADMNSNGMLIYTRAYNAASTAGAPAVFAIQIGKGLKGKTVDLYKSSSKAISGEIDNVVQSTASESGLFAKSYDEKTGVLLVDAGICWNTTTTSKLFYFSDVTSQTSGYLVINASKNPALTGMNVNRVAARGVNSSGQVIPSATNTTVTYDATKTFDSHGALNAATGVFTCPAGQGGYYQVNAGILYSSNAWAAGNSTDLYIAKNGAVIKNARVVTPTATLNFGTTNSDAIYLIPGDTVSIIAWHNRGAGTALQADINWNNFSIAKIGN